VREVDVALGIDALAACPAADTGGDGAVSIAELLTAVQRSADGCPAA
jgi:hypothetical protein